MAKIKLTNSVQIDISSLSYGIDVSNQLASTMQGSISGTTTKSYKATKDCVMFFAYYGSSHNIKKYIDNVEILKGISGWSASSFDQSFNGGTNAIIIPLRANQTFKIQGTEGTYAYGWIVYAVK